MKDEDKPLPLRRSDLEDFIRGKASPEIREAIEFDLEVGGPIWQKQVRVKSGLNILLNPIRN